MVTSLNAYAADRCTLTSLTIEKSELKRLLELSDDCGDISDFNSNVGRLALRLGDVDVALQYLEKAVMLDQYNGAALVDYAQALSVSGAVEASNAIYNRILDMKSVPEILRIEIKKRIEQNSPNNALRAVFFEIGRSGNLNNGTTIDTVNLSIADGSYRLRLDDAYVASTGWYTNSALAFIEDATQSYISVRNTQSGSANKLSAGHLRNYSVPLGLLNEATLSAELFREDNVSAFQVRADVNMKGFGPFEKGDVNLLLGIGGEMGGERLEYLRSGVLFSKQLVGSSFRLRSRLQYTNEEPFNVRPGGSLSQVDLILSAERLISSGVLGYEYVIKRTLSSDGYSVLLSSNERLRTTQRVHSVGYKIVLNPQWSISFDMRHKDTSSNIDIFDRKHSDYSLSVSYEF